MATSPEFRKRLGREVRLFVRETQDGCVECRAAGGTCHEHSKLFADLVLHPRKYIRLPADRQKGEAAESDRVRGVQ
jgi:hypothetical protein